MNINTATEEELLKHGLEKARFFNGADIARQLIVARPFTSWKDLAHRKGFTWQHSSFLYWKHYRLHDGELQFRMFDEMTFLFHTRSFT